jgi:hypothetical protein
MIFRQFKHANYSQLCVVYRQILLTVRICCVTALELKFVYFVRTSEAKILKYGDMKFSAYVQTQNNML